MKKVIGTVYIDSRAALWYNVISGSKERWSEMVYYEPNDALVARYPGGSFGINLYEFSTEHFFSAEDGMP